MNLRTVKVCLLCSFLLMAIGCQTWSGARNAPQIKQASVNGVTLDYQEQGDGAPVVFIHGCCTDYRAWDAQRQAIAPHYRFIGLNMRYFGTAPWPDDGSKYSQQTGADDVAAFIRGLKAGPVHLVGWSYSGPIVMLVALRHPELVRSLTVHEPGTVSYVTDPAKPRSRARIAWPRWGLRSRQRGPATSQVRLGLRRSGSTISPISGRPRRRVPCSSTMRALGSPSTAPPHPLFNTVGDRSLYRIASEGAAGCIPGVQFVTIPGRHLAIAQQPAAFNAALVQLLRRTEALIGARRMALP